MSNTLHSCILSTEIKRKQLVSLTLCLNKLRTLDVITLSVSVFQAAYHFFTVSFLYKTRAKCLNSNDVSSRLVVLSVSINGPSRDQTQQQIRI